MEWFRLIIPVSILSSNNVSVSVWLCLPRGFVEELGIRLETTCNCTLSVTLSQLIIKLHFSHGHLGKSVWLSSKCWLQIGLSESG